MTRLKNALCAMALCTLSGCVRTPPIPDMSHAVSSPAPPLSATVPVLLDDRMYVELTFFRPDGTPRKALAFVNMGSVPLILSNELFRELRPKPGRALHMEFGALDIGVDGAAVQPETMANNATITINPFAKTPTAEDAAKETGGLMAAMTAPLKVEAVLPAGVLEHFEVVFDYSARTMTLAAPGTLKPEGVAVPVRVNPESGFVILDAKIDGQPYPLVLDNGGSFSAARDVAPWLAAHPGWLRSIGGIGPANLVMGPEGYEAGDPVLKIPGVSLGPLALGQLGVMEIGPQGWLGRHATDWLFWDGIYSAKAGEPVKGWIGGNVLKSFRITIDYAGRMTYWQQQRPIDTHDLDQVGIVLAHQGGVTTVAGIASKDGVPVLVGIEPGDKLITVDGRDTATLTRGALLDALHGRPGDRKHLVLERGGKRYEIDAAVTAF